MCRFATGCCKTHCNGCMNVAWALFWGGSRSTKPCIFPCKVAAAGDERYLLCAAVAAAVGLPFFLPHCNGGFKLLWLCLCVRSYREFWNLWLQIALEWLHECCMGFVLGRKPGARNLVFFRVKWLQPALAETRSSTTVHYKACTNTFQYYRILQSLQKHVPVLPYTTKLAQSRSSATVYTTKLAETRSSTTVYYKACTKSFQYYRILQSLPALLVHVQLGVFQAVVWSSGFQPATSGLIALAPRKRFERDQKARLLS